MRDSIYTKLYARELTSPAVRAPTLAYRRLYSDHSLVADLDIVNELDGHSGCVNALSWSKSGQLLASGSDDQHLNIHTYQPAAEGGQQFKLSTSVATGHTQNIFSVKFMPGHGDRVCVTAAGDSEVRVFDLEYSGRTREASVSSSMARESRSRRNTVYNGVRYLSDGDTDCRVYRCHADRVKRIVTESSPYLFLTCSEDGEVRQWDIRQPSSAYPAPRGSRWGPSAESDIPPPLISYKRYSLDLNTISCSPSQPHYIALGGAHLHCFLHDRRMTGRDRLREAGKSLSPSASRTGEEEELMSQATQCVRKFAPNGQPKMKRTESGHITACKISDARPDEMVVSWSGDHIYSFDLVRSPDANEVTSKSGVRQGSGIRVKGSERKRKRKVNDSDQSLGQQEAFARGSSRPRTDLGSSEDAAAALRVRYQNGQSEDVPIVTHAPAERGRQEHSVLSAKQREAQRIAKSTVRIRSALFGQNESRRDQEARFTTALGEAASIISDIDEAMRDWHYPMEPSTHQVSWQQLQRRNRERTRRFVQAAGTISRVLGGKLRTGSSGQSTLLAHFTSLEARSNDLPLASHEQFGYDFIKAILLWVESGIGRLIEGFTRPAGMLATVKAAQRLPIPESEACMEAIDDILVPSLLSMASDKPIINLETSRFEVDENRHLFPTEKAAVLAFAAAVKIPFSDLSSAVVLAEDSGSARFQAQDRQTATTFWTLKVARAVLLNAAEDVNFVFVDRAFGGLGRVVREIAEVEQGLEEIGVEEEEGIRSVEVIHGDGIVSEWMDVTAATDVLRANVGGDVAVADDDAGADDGDASDDDASSADNEESETSEDEDDVPPLGLPRFMYPSAFERRRRKEKVEAKVACSAATRTYAGHCNVRTVKDVNYFGLDDEYVVSGSDDGNLFIWDRRTAQLVNILDGDGEVVNVVQAHPYETMLAVSGIDHTVKIFSPDSRARAAARRGEGVAAHDPSEFSSIIGSRRFGRREVWRGRAADDVSDAAGVTSEPAMEERDSPVTEEAAKENEGDAADSDDEYLAATGLASRKRMHEQYSITSHNDAERQGGNQDAYITVSRLEQLFSLRALLERLGE